MLRAKDLLGPRAMTMTMGPNDQQTASSYVVSSVDVVQRTPGLLRDVIREHRNALASLHGELKLDVRLSAQGRQQLFAEAAADIAARSSTLVQEIRARAENAITVLKDAIAAALVDPVEGAEGILGRQAQWARAKEMMAADISLRTIIDEAKDPEMLNAIFDEYPTWARINFKNSTTDQAEDALELYALRIERRFAELAGNTRIGANARVAIAARPDVIVLPMMLDTAARSAASTDPAQAVDLHAALGANLLKAKAKAALHVVQEGELRPDRRHGV